MIVAIAELVAAASRARREAAERARFGPAKLVMKREGQDLFVITEAANQTRRIRALLELDSLLAKPDVLCV